MSDQAAVVQDALFDEFRALVDSRTLDLVKWRRRRAVVRRRGWLVRRMLLVADIFGLVAALFLSEWLVGTHTRADAVTQRTEVLLFLLTIPGWIVGAKLYGLYNHDEERTDHSTTDDFSGVFHMITVCTWLFAAGGHVSGFAYPSIDKLLVFWASAIALVSVGRAGTRVLARRQTAYLQNALIVGAGEVGQLIAKKLLQHPEYGINLVGFVDDSPKATREDLGHLALLGGPERLREFVELFDVERVIVAFSNDTHERTLDLIRSIKDLDVQIDIVPRLFELVGPGVGIHTVEGLPLVGLPPVRLARSSLLLKRTSDFVLALVGLIVLAPLFAVVALLVKLDSPGPVFFRQVRMGRADKTFRMWKFRTMVADADERKHEVAHLNKHLRNGGDPRMFKIPDDPRVTRLGRFLRSYSIDELPQLANVVLGDMSLVGPRPLILAEDRHVDDWGRQRLNLKPGCTGPWQVLGRTGIPFSEMVKLDYLYVTGWSLRGDLGLLVKTIPVLLRGAD